MQFLVGFGSIRCLEHNALICAFLLAWEKQIQIVSVHGFIAQAFCFFGRLKNANQALPCQKRSTNCIMAMQMSLEEYRAVRFMSSGFQRMERAELGKSKLPEVSLHTIYYFRTPYLIFSLNTKSNYNFANQFIGGG